MDLAAEWDVAAAEVVESVLQVEVCNSAACFQTDSSGFQVQLVNWSIAIVSFKIPQKVTHLFMQFVS